MNKMELVNAVAAKTKETKKATDAAVDAVFESIQEELAKGGKVQIIGFGTFEVRARKERTGRNPQSGEAIQISAANHPGFSAGKALKDAVNAEN
jgi:DNA-binding protein HU-beta